MIHVVVRGVRDVVVRVVVVCVAAIVRIFDPPTTLVWLGCFVLRSYLVGQCPFV